MNDKHWWWKRELWEIKDSWVCSCSPLLGYRNYSKYSFEVWDPVLVGIKGLLTATERQKNVVFQCDLFWVELNLLQLWYGLIPLCLGSNSSMTKLPLYQRQAEDYEAAIKSENKEIRVSCLLYLTCEAPGLILHLLRLGLSVRDTNKTTLWATTMGL